MIWNNVPQVVKSSEVAKQLIVQEKLLYKLERRVFSDKYINANENFELRVRRLLQTDELIIELHYTNHDSRLTNIDALATINNKEIKFTRVQNDPSSGKYVFSAILKRDKDWANFKWSELNNINFELSTKEGYWQTYQKLYGITYYFGHSNMQKDINVPTQGVNIRLLTFFSIKFFNQEEIQKSASKHSYTEWLNFVAIPREIKQGIWNKTFYDLELYKSTSKNDKKDYDLNQTDHNGIDVKGEISDRLIEGEYQLICNLFGKENTLAINSNSYYDHKQKKTIFSPDHPDAQLGFILPPNFYGNFSHQTTIDFGNQLKGFKLTYNQKILNPYFSPTIGKVKLWAIEYNKLPQLEKWQTIKYENINKITKENITLEEIGKIGGE